MAIGYTEGRRLKFDDYNQIKSKQKLNDHDLKALFSAILVIVNVSIRSFEKQKKQIFKNDLISLLKLVIYIS